MVERKVTVNPRASAVVITKNPKHIQVNPSGIEKLKDEVISQRHLSHRFDQLIFRLFFRL